jgi:primosomal protein N' (replication factor Y)
MFGKRVLGPEFALIPRIKNLYHKKILLKIAREESAVKVKEKIFELISRLQNNDAYKTVKVQADVDPM